ncbi:MAG: GntR family transcriptional regulator [Anaerolineae bacterium]|nr:GntR family transcriptional regulator [Anaerolineae bacterium]MDW8068019.1 GntR family transcriptional regulator [Anaerolineae bacterium]
MGSKYAIDRDSYEPAYAQLARILSLQIAEGLYRPGDQLPSEAQLVAQFGVSPMTVRRAINLLLSRGIVSTAQGRGTFVRGLAIHEATFRLQEVGDREAERTVRLLQATILPADGRVARKLAISPGTRVIYLRRLVSRAEGPTMYHREYLIYDPHRPLVEAELQITSLEGLFKGDSGQGLRRGDLCIEAVTLTPEEAELLAVPPGSPAFCLEHIFYDFTNQPVAWGWFICRADRFRLTTCIGPDAKE